MRITLAAIALTILIVSPLVLGQTSQPVPAITSVSGTVAPGQALTINGSNLVQQDTTRFNTRFQTTYPTAWNFSGASRAADGWGEAGMSGGVYDATVHFMGSAPTMRFSINATVPPENADQDAIIQDDNEFWASFYFRYEQLGANWPDGHIKQFYVLTPAGGWFVQPQAQIGMPTTFVVEWNGLAPYTFNVPSGRLQSGRWYHLEVHMRTVSPYAIDVWMDGQAVYSTTAPTAGGSISYAYNGLGNIDCSSSMAINLNYRLGMYAIGNQRIYPSSLVEIGNNSDYAAATKRVQPFTSIADTSLGVTLDLTGLGSGPYYLWVTNNRQQRSPAFPLGAATGPAAPTAVVIR